MEKTLVLYFTFSALFGAVVASGLTEEEGLINPTQLEKFVDELPDMPQILGFDIVNGVPKPKFLNIGMFMKKWKFHRDLPPTPVFAYGTSKHTASVPGPTIEALHGIDTYVTWQNHLPSKHILPWDPTILTAVPSTKKGIPTVVHLHGAIDEPASDGNPSSWFTARFEGKGTHLVQKNLSLPQLATAR
ncbi:hypothetical protein Patl1_15279 [Pistacia atlantica]|uniref:Uncharacterized protein n=1 Tax=Pistacia atlantica TaxID=434234 RepID=A0ACC1B8Q9_9ROSI|nr:hypothetical protein Patl1_15279 [Pistacia atlantica]